MNSPRAFLASILLIALSRECSLHAVSTLEFARPSTVTVAENAGEVALTVLRTGDLDSVVTVDFATADGTAKAGSDYSAASGTLTFAAGETNQPLVIRILNDALPETTERFAPTLSNPSANATLGTAVTAQVAITDTDPGIQVEFAQYWADEGSETVTVGVTRGVEEDFPATVAYATADSTARAATDYEAVAGTLEFGATEKLKLVVIRTLNDGMREANETFSFVLSIPVRDDGVAEADEKFRLTLSNPSGAITLGTAATATITILDTTGMEPHRFSGIAVLSDGGVQLTLAGAVHQRFKPYFDLYPIEVSTNLADWTPLVTLQRTNVSTNVLTWLDTEASKLDRRFYRTVANHLITPVTKPTGPFPVGVVSRRLTDPSRRNRYHVSTNGSFMISLWYPGLPEAGKLPERLEDQPLALDPGWPASWEATPLPDREPYFVSHALPELECTSAQAPYPVLIFSHGAYDGPTTIMERGPEIASHGYVVVGVSH